MASMSDGVPGENYALESERCAVIPTMPKEDAMRKVGLILGLALVVFACSEQAGQMLVDAGEMMMDGSVPDAGAQDTPVECNKSESSPVRRSYLHAALGRVCGDAGSN